MKSFTDPEWYAPSFRCPILASKSTIWTGHRHEFSFSSYSSNSILAGAMIRLKSMIYCYYGSTSCVIIINSHVVWVLS